MAARSTAAARSRSARSAPRAGNQARTRNVWLSLLGAMTVVGGALVLLDGKPAPAVDGLTLTPLVATGVTPSIESIFHTRQSVVRGRWQHIMIHATGSASGSPETLDSQARGQKLAGLGHHFVIGNGRGMEDGELHVAYRWLDQAPGAHAAGTAGAPYNTSAISICLVGDGNRGGFTRAQMDRLVEVIRSLQERLGIPAQNVLLHSDAVNIADPGRLFPEAWLRQQLR